MLRPKYIMARSYQLTGAMAALVTDAGGASRSVTVAALGTWVRARLADAAWTGNAASTPRELFTLVQSALNAGSGAGTWAITPEPDGRVRVAWSGPGAATLFAGAVTRALGFTGGVAVSAGGSLVSAYPAQGVLLWGAAKGDSDWVPSSAGATAQDEAGRVYRRSAGIVTYARTLTAWWLPRAWSNNDSGEYFSPVYWAEQAFAGANAALSPDPVGSTATGPTSWLDGLYSISGSIPWGFSDDYATLTADARVSEVYLAPETYSEPRISLPSEAATLRPRRSVDLTLSRTSNFGIAL